MSKKGPTPTTKQLAEFDKPQVLKDLGYEVDMLRATYERAFKNDPDLTVHNAVVELWGMHARALTEFFMDKRNAAPVSAFVDAKYGLLKTKDAEALFASISNQMSHLQLRPTKEEDKVRPNAADMQRLENEIAKFRKHLKSGYHAQFVVNSEPVKIASLPKASATSAISSTTSTHNPSAQPTGPRKPSL